MTYVVTDNCIACKYTDCVEVCPVDCFYEGENMLVIHPDECIDCGVCEPECPADAVGHHAEPPRHHGRAADDVDVLRFAPQFPAGDFAARRPKPRRFTLAVRGLLSVDATHEPHAGGAVRRSGSYAAFAGPHAARLAGALAADA